MNTQLKENVPPIVSGLEASRDDLLDLAKALVGVEVGSWADAQSLFELAKRTDLIRMELAQMMLDSSHATPDNKARQTFSRSSAVTGSKAIRKRKEDYPKYSV